MPSLASIIQGEARSYEGQLAVANVINNRALAGTFPGGSDVYSVANAPNQFVGSQPPTAQATAIANQLQNGTLPSDNTGGATYYFGLERGAMVHTDGWRGYAGLAAAGYQHQVTVLSGGSDPAHEVMPRVHLVASLLKRWLIGTHQGGIQHQHLNYYLDEFTFRFNRRRSKARGLLFHRLAQQALAAGPAPYNAIVKPAGSSGSPTTGQ